MVSTFKSSLADRGKKAEDMAKKALALWQGDRADREVERLMDTRAAGRVVKASAADYAFYAEGVFGLLEVKSTEHEYRLSRANITQLPRMRKRELTGGVCLVLVYHSTLNVWRCMPIHYLATTGDKGSWNLTDVPTHANPGLALASVSDVFSDMLDSSTPPTVYCHYCRKHKTSFGFKVLIDPIHGNKRYRCPECHEVRVDPDAREAKTKRDTETRQGAQATRILLSKQAREAKRRKE